MKGLHQDLSTKNGLTCKAQVFGWADVLPKKRKMDVYVNIRIPYTHVCGTLRCCSKPGGWVCYVSYYWYRLRSRGCNFVQGCIVEDQCELWKTSWLPNSWRDSLSWGYSDVKPKVITQWWPVICDKILWRQYITNDSQISKYKSYMIQMRGPWHLNFKRSEHTSSLTIMSCLWVVRLLRRSLSWSKESPY